MQHISASQTLASSIQNVCMEPMKAHEAESSCNQAVIDSATVFNVNLPLLSNISMILCNITTSWFSINN